MEIWEAMALGLKKGDGGIHLITYHPRGASSSSTFFHNKDWLDVNMYQSGHSKHFESVYRYAENDRTKTPAKPTIEGEPGYEDIAIEFWQFMDFSKPSERVSAYWNLLSGAAGYTYGNNAVWQMFRKGGEVAIPALFDWKKSLDRPGANDMRHVHELFTKRPFNKLVPDQTLILGDNPKGSTYILAAQANDQSFCIFYASVGQLIPVDLSKMGDSIDAFWFDPRDGTVRAANFPENGSSFIPPTSGKGNDWVLILDNPSVNLPEL